MNVEQICDAANKLSVTEGGELISRLIQDLGSSEYDVSDEEVPLRVEETRSGTVEDISLSDLELGLNYLW
jgi:hypothetical protein